MHVKYIFFAILTILFTFCITLGVLSTGNLFPPVPKLEKLKILRQPVSNEFPLILPVKIIVMMFFLLCINKASGRTYLQVKRVSSLHHMNKSSRPKAEQCKRADQVCPFKKMQHRHRGRRPRCQLYERRVMAMSLQGTIYFSF